MTYVAIVSLIMLIQFTLFGLKVGMARGTSGIKAPAMTGDDAFERAVRVHLNTGEQLLAALPAMWICAHYFSPEWAAGLGALFVIGRFLYAQAYYKDAGKRTPGMMIGFMAMTLMVLLGLYGTISQLV